MTGESVCVNMSCHTHLTTLPLDIAQRERAVTTTNKTVQININLTVKEHLFSEFTAVYGQKNIAFPHLSNIYTCTYIYYIHWDEQDTNKIRKISNAFILKIKNGTILP